jgi:hypothetical protein
VESARRTLSAVSFYKVRMITVDSEAIIGQVPVITKTQQSFEVDVES